MGQTLKFVDRSYTTEELMSRYEAFNPVEKVHVLTRALKNKRDFRTPEESICLAMGYVRNIEDRVTWVKL